MLISHEIPKQLFPYHDLISDYPYVLGHLLEKDKEYAKFYFEKVQRSEFSILDNSAFELGASIDSEKLFNLALQYKPKVLVLPDTLHDCKTTIKDSQEFIQKYRDELDMVGVKCMGVLQGKSFDELLECFEEYKSFDLKYIAIPFDCIKDSNWHTIRIQFWKQFVEEIDNKSSKMHFHFLGIENPSELLCYSEKELSLISSIDTSSPIVNGWCGQRFTDYGLETSKPKSKLADNLDIVIIDENIEVIIHNVKQFKVYARR